MGMKWPQTLFVFCGHGVQQMLNSRWVNERKRFCTFMCVELDQNHHGAQREREGIYECVRSKSANKYDGKKSARFKRQLTTRNGDNIFSLYLHFSTIGLAHSFASESLDWIALLFPPFPTCTGFRTYTYSDTYCISIRFMFEVSIRSFADVLCRYEILFRVTWIGFDQIDSGNKIGNRMNREWKKGIERKRKEWRTKWAKAKR